MGLLSFLSKNKQETASGEGEFYSRAEEESQVARGRKRRQGKSSKATNSPANSPIDPVLPEKKRARRRLVGAIALVLAMIIGLPMILDSEPKPVSEDIAIQIPSKDKQSIPPAVVGPTNAPGGASASGASVPLAASLGQQEQVVPMPPPNSGASVPTSATPVRMPAPAAAPSASVSSPVTAAPVKVKPDAKPQEKPVSVPAAASVPAHDTAEAKPQVKVEHAAEKHDDARAEAILEGKDAADGGKPNADKKSAKFVVQVAALASQEKVNELQGKLTEAGIKSYVQKVATDSGERIMRVRIGPFSSKDEAESARAKLSKMGLSGKLMPS
jgi:DedD protein